MRGLFASLIGAIGLAGCLSTPEGAPPPWFAEREANTDETYPSLRDVPRTSDANTNEAHWAALERELLALGQAVKDSPRAQSAAAAESPTEFLENARQELEAARLAHDPN